MKPYLRIALALVAAFALVPSASAALTFLTEENPPFNYTEKGTLTGVATEIVREMANRAGFAFKTEVLPWEIAYVRAQGEKNACLFATARLENRERIFLWVGPIATNFWAVFGKGDFGVPVKTVKDLAPYRIGAVSRDAKGEFLRDNGVTNLRLVRDDRDNPARLLLPPDDPDHIDLWITGLYSGRGLASAAKVTSVKVVLMAAEQPLFVACNPQTDRATVKALADALDAMRADGTLAKINAAWQQKFSP
jgi:polar amino acid transport system substrate-binding protein